MSTGYKQLCNLVSSMNLTLDDVPIAMYMNSFHEVVRVIRQRKDTKQYIYIETCDSHRDGVDDYFRWYYLSEEKIKKYKLPLNDMCTESRYIDFSDE